MSIAVDNAFVGEDLNTVALKLRERELLIKRAELVKLKGIEYYRPHPKQELFHRAGKFRRRAFFAGNRTGKSECGVAEDVSMAMGFRPFFKEGDPARYVGIPQRPLKILVVTTDWDKVESVFTGEGGANPGKFWRMFPRGYVKRKTTNHSGVVDFMELSNGSIIRFDTVKSFKNNPQGSESDDWDHVHWDEPVPQKMRDAVMRGSVDRGASEMFTLTPLTEPWIWDMFYGEDGNAQDIVKRGEVHLYNDIYWSVVGSMDDNPYLTPEARDLYLAELSDEERETRRHGIPLQFAGLVYKQYSDAVHMMQRVPNGWDDYDQPSLEETVYVYMDPHPQTPTHVMFVCVGVDGRRYIFNELWTRDNSTEIARSIRKIIGARQVMWYKGDPCMFNEDKMSGTCWASDFAQEGIFFERAIKDPSRGIKEAQKALETFDHNGMPTWMVSPYCKRFRWEIKRFHWKDGENKPVDKDDHAMENFYRAVLDKPQYVKRNDDDDKEIKDAPIDGRRDFEKLDYSSY